MTFKIGDYVRRTKEKKLEGLDLDSLFEAANSENGLGLLEQQKEGLYIVTKIPKFLGGTFEASLSDVIYPKLRVKD
jgi:hypothetical protein